MSGIASGGPGFFKCVYGAYQVNRPDACMTRGLL
jgi:hypothetical protein